VGVVAVLTEQQVFADWLALRLPEVGLAFGGCVAEPARLADEVDALEATMVVSEATLTGAEPMALVASARRRHPSLRAAIVDRDASTHQIAAALRSGVSAYFAKSDDPIEIVRGLRAAHDGRLAFGDAALRACPALGELAGRPPSAARGFTLPDESGLSELTPREREILALMGQGLWRMQIAERLCRSPKTIDKHRASIMKKLDAHDHAGLVLIAVREGLVDLERLG